MNIREALQRWLLAIASGSIVLALLMAMAPHSLAATSLGSDGGDLLAAVLTGGIPHPTGYPTYLLLGTLLQKLPWGTALWRGTLASALPAAAAAGLLAAWVAHHSNHAGLAAHLSGLLSGLAWGTTPLFLQIGSTVEVYGLFALSAVLALWWLTLLADLAKSPSAPLLIMLAGAFGLGLGNHLTLALMLPPAAALLYKSYRSEQQNWLVWGQVAALCTGLTVYIILPVRAGYYPAINWGDPQTLKGFLWEITAQPYQVLLFKPQAATLISRLTGWFAAGRGQIGVLGFAASLVGALQFAFPQRSTNYLLWWFFGSYSIFAIVYQTADSLAYLLPAYMVLAAWLGRSIQGYWEFRTRGIPWGLVIGIAGLLYLGVRLANNWYAVRATLDTSIDQVAQELLQIAPQGSVVLTQSDPDTFPLWYHHFGLGRRPDLIVIVEPLTRYTWYRDTLTQTYPAVHFPQHDSIDSLSWVDQVIKLNPERPFCRSMIERQPILKINYDCTG